MAIEKEINLKVNDNLEPSIKNLRELKKQLRETAAGTKEFDVISQRIRDMDDAIKDANKTSDDFKGYLENASGPLGMLGKGIRQAEQTFSSWNAVMKASVIGAIVALLGGLAAAFSENEDAQKKLKPITEAMSKIFNGVYRIVEPLFNILVDLATKALPIVAKGFSGVYSAVSAVFESLGSIGKAIYKLITGDFSGAWDEAKKSVTDFGKHYDEANKRFEKGSKELTASEKEELAKRRENEKKHQEELAKQKEVAHKKALEAQRKRQEEEKKLREEAYQKRNEEAQTQGRIAEERFAKEQKERGDALMAELEAMIDFDQRVLDNASKNATDKANIDLQNAKNAELSFEERLQAIADREAQEKDIIFKSEEEKTAFEKANSEARIALAKAERDAKIAQMVAISGALDGLSKVAGENTKAGKVLAIASATINMYKGIMEVWGAKSMGNPIVDMAVKIASSAIVAAQGISTINKIVSVQVPGGGGGGGAVSTPTTSAPAPSFNVVGSSGTNQLAQAIGKQSTQPVEAYVVASNVTSAQSLNRNIVTSATIG